MEGRWRVILEDWLVVKYHEAVARGVVLTRFCLKGRVFEHPAFSAGTEITTSPIADVYQLVGMVITKSGTAYRLGNPDKKWARENEKTCRILKAV